MKPRALVVDDEQQMLAIVTFALETQGFSCDSTADPVQAFQMATTGHYHLLVLDVLLPKMSGVALTEKIRAVDAHTPIILLTALGEEEHRIRGLEAGADDYVTKPFSPRELALRAQALVRRSAPKETSEWHTFGELQVNTVRSKALWRGLLVTESAVEVKLLLMLAQAQGAPVPARQLIRYSWEVMSIEGGRQMLKTTIYRLRKKMESVGLDPGVIEAQRGLGYALRLPADH